MLTSSANLSTIARSDDGGCPDLLSQQKRGNGRRAQQVGGLAAEQQAAQRRVPEGAHDEHVNGLILHRLGDDAFRIAGDQ